MGCGCPDDNNKSIAIRTNKPIGTVTDNDINVYKQRLEICTKCTNLKVTKSDFRVKICSITNRLVDNYVINEDACPVNHW